MFILYYSCLDFGNFYLVTGIRLELWQNGFDLQEFDWVYGPAWHCIVGTSFGSFVTHSVGGFLYFSMDRKLYILLFKTTVQKADWVSDTTNLWRWRRFYWVSPLKNLVKESLACTFGFAQKSSRISNTRFIFSNVLHQFHTINELVWFLKG